MPEPTKPHDQKGNQPNTTNEAAKQRPDEASKVNLEKKDKASPTKPQTVHGKNVNRPQSAG